MEVCGRFGDRLRPYPSSPPLCLLKPELHVHLAVHRRRGDEVFVGQLDSFGNGSSQARKMPGPSSTLNPKGIGQLKFAKVSHDMQAIAQN